jgi:hypothetical protein
MIQPKGGRWGIGNPNKEPVEASKAVAEAVEHGRKWQEWEQLKRAAVQCGDKKPEEVAKTSQEVLDKGRGVCYTISSGESLEQWKANIEGAFQWESWETLQNQLDKLKKV